MFSHGGEQVNVEAICQPRQRKAVSAAMAVGLLLLLLLLLLMLISVPWLLRDVGDCGTYCRQRWCCCPRCWCRHWDASGTAIRFAFSRSWPLILLVLVPVLVLVLVLLVLVLVLVLVLLVLCKDVARKRAKRQTSMVVSQSSWPNQTQRAGGCARRLLMGNL